MFSKNPKAEVKKNLKPAKRTDKPGIPSIISVGLHISGNMKTNGDLQIDGVIDGDVESKELTIGEGAKVNGSVVAETIRVAGTVNGQLTGQIIELANTATVIGDISHSSLSVEAGAFLQGLCMRVDSQQLISGPDTELNKTKLSVTEVKKL